MLFSSLSSSPRPIDVHPSTIGFRGFKTCHEHYGNHVMNLVQIFKTQKLEKKFYNLHKTSSCMFIWKVRIHNQIGPKFLSHLKPTPFQSFHLIVW
jgi:hypothetical protein